MASNYSKSDQDFLRFSAYSFKDLLTRKFSENTKFTDQIYEGSNLAILIDLCAYLFQGLTYSLNQAAAESMFSDTKIYENINRLVKLIGYNPKGFIPSTCEFEIESSNFNDDAIIPRYTAIDTGKVDSDGNAIYYSVKEDFSLGNGKKTVKLYNGRWHLYPTVFTATGEKYETFVLDQVRSDSTGTNKKYDAYGFIDAYVIRNNKMIQYQGLTDEIFLNMTSKYDQYSYNTISIYKNTNEDNYFSIRLNQNKTYEIKFGNDNNGTKLQAGDKVYVFYMSTNGFDGGLNIGEVSNQKFKEPALLLGITDEMMYKSILGYDDATIDDVKQSIEQITNIVNTTASTIAIAEESVSDIREIAPDFYKLGNRLVSKSDFEYYVKNRYKDDIIDAKCHNNWDYISNFYGWLYNLGQSGVRTEYGTTTTPIRDKKPTYYIQQEVLSKYDYYFADPADENNVYLWVKTQTNSEVTKKELDSDLNAIKILTSEIVYVEPIDVYFMICAAPEERCLQYLDNDQIFDKDGETYLEITINDNTIYSNTALKTQIDSTFKSYFKQVNLKLGQLVSISDLESQLYSINGVTRIRTVFTSDQLDDDGNKVYKDKFIDGISLASWSASLIDPGDDLVVSTTNRSLEEFQFPMLYSESISDRIKIIKRSFSNNSTVQY